MMSAADVRFLDLAGDPVEPGEKPVRFTFRCVGHNRDRDQRLEVVQCGNLLIAGATNIKRDGQGQNGGTPQWDWDGNRDAPTFTPSINCEKYCKWHGYIRAGRCVSVAGADEP